MCSSLPRCTPQAIDPSQPLELALAGATRQVLRLRIRCVLLQLLGLLEEAAECLPCQRQHPPAACCPGAARQVLRWRAHQARAASGAEAASRPAIGSIRLR